MFDLKETYLQLRLSTQQDLLQANTHIQSNKDLFLNGVVYDFYTVSQNHISFDISFYIPHTLKWCKNTITVQNIVFQHEPV